MTWNLKGALPADVIAMIGQERDRLASEPLRSAETASTRKIRHDKLVFAFTDKILDTAVQGPLDLRDSANATIVEDAILFGVPDRYELFA